MKQTIGKWIRAFFFIGLTVSLIVLSSYMLAPKGNSAEDGINNPVAHGFLSEPKNTIDITVIGNSDAYSGYSPMEMWNGYGFTSYVSGEGKQSPAQSYAMLKAVYEQHTPKLAILETDNFFSKSKIVESVAKLVNASLGSPFSVFQYHNRWKTAKPDEWFKTPDYQAHNAAKGQWLSNEIRGYYGGEYMRKTVKESMIPEGNKASIEAFLRLCETNGTKVILVELPSQSSWNYKKHNAVKRFADDHELPFLDLNLDREQFDLDWKTDSRDGGNHLNCAGAKKATLFLGKYISENYVLPDRRADATYRRWHEDYKEYQKTAKTE